MPRLSNPTISRIEYVAKQAKVPEAFFATVVSTMFAIGEDRLGEDLLRKQGKKPLTVEKVLDIVRPKLKDSHRFDPVIPWLYFQYRGAFQSLPWDDFVQLTREVDRRAAVIGQWRKKEKIDINKYDIFEVLETVKGWSSGTIAKKVGKIVYEFADGWTIQELPSSMLVEEGDVMGHCVGRKYCDKVDAGESQIFSLRDSKNNPHVTIEYDPRDGKFVQIYGKQNEKPLEKYAVRVREWITEKYDADVLGLFIAGADPKTLDFRGEDLRGADFMDADLRGLNLMGADLTGAALGSADIRDANLRDVTFDGAFIPGANMSNSDLRGADFNGADLENCILQNADLRGADLRGTNLRGVDFYKANISGANLYQAYLNSASLYGADFSHVDLNNVNLYNVDLRNANLRNTKLVGAFLFGVKYNKKTKWPKGFEIPEEAILVD